MHKEIKNLIEKVKECAKEVYQELEERRWGTNIPTFCRMLEYRLI